MGTLQCAVSVLRSRRKGFDYNFHNRVEAGTAGIYAFWLESGACLYVGQSVNLGRRMYQHRMNEHNTELERFFRAFAQQVEVSYISLKHCSESELRRLEIKVISILRPLTNRT